MPESKPRLLFYFLHLLGVGHVYRAKRLIDAFTAEGICVHVVYGGMPLDSVSFNSESVHFLPPIRSADATYKRLLDGDHNDLTAEYMADRKAALLNIFAELEVDAIITEAFPFGRRVVQQELDALFTTANESRNPPLIISSVRDILQGNRKPGRREEMRDWVLNRFDRVLVHADPSVITLDKTFPFANDIKHKLAYTGFVVPATQETAVGNRFDVIVSSGGGMFGGDLTNTALQLANSESATTEHANTEIANTKAGRRTWCIATGPNPDSVAASELRSQAAPQVTVVDYLDNLAEHMKHARISISQCGYNTAMDVLAAHEVSDCRAVFVPHDTTGQTEQLQRAKLLQDAGYAVCIPQSQLTVESLGDAVQRAGQLPRVSRVIDFNGAANSAKLLRQWVSEHCSR